VTESGIGNRTGVSAESDEAREPASSGIGSTPDRRYLVRLLVLAMLLLVTLSVAAWIVFRAERDQTEHVEQVFESYAVLRSFQSVLQNVVDAQSGGWGYIITGNDEFLEPYRRAVIQLERDRAVLSALAGTRPNLAAAVNRVLAAADRARELIEETMAVFRRFGLEAARARVAALQLKGEVDALRSLVAEVTGAEQTQLRNRTSLAQAAIEQVDSAVVGSFLVAVFVLLLSTWIVYREYRRRLALESMLERKTRDHEVDARIARNLLRHRETLREFRDLLQSARTTDEACGIIARGLDLLAPHEAGSVCLIGPSRDHAESVRAWGEAAVSETVFAPDDCYGLRRGRQHACLDPGRDLRCPHVHAEHRGPHLCLPLVAHGETLGVLVLGGPALAGLDPRIHDNLSLAMESISIALANIRLHEALRDLSVQDPLTGLYNRRYLEAALTREIARAERRAAGIAVLMADLDHFKALNDRWGHDAGDHVLIQVGRLLRTNARGEDVACRFGGEEFMMILPDTGLSTALARAEQIRAAVESLVIRHHSETLRPVTISLGISVYPEHGRSPADLMRAADRALYEAKRGGRNCVRQADSAPATDGSPRDTSGLPTRSTGKPADGAGSAPGAFDDLIDPR
jgi:diguanylate cyclase (GGDEF)-like protein